MTEYLLNRDLVLGLEVIPEYVEELRGRFAAHPNVRIECLDITSTSFDFAALNFMPHLGSAKDGCRSSTPFEGEA